MSCVYRYGVPNREHLKALIWRESTLISRNSESTTYRYIQMAWLAFMVATGFLKDEVTHSDTVRVRFFPQSSSFSKSSSLLSAFKLHCHVTVCTLVLKSLFSMNS